MVPPFRVTFAESAVRDLEEIRQWYAQQQADDVGEVIEQTAMLGRFPESGRVVPEFGVPRLRELIHPPFRIVYRWDDDRVRVVRLWRSERLLDEPSGE